MMEYDLTATRVFSDDHDIPTEAEMFVITLGLLIVKSVSYTEMQGCILEFTTDELEKMAICIEEEVPLFTRDMGQGDQLRERLGDFVGLRIHCPFPEGRAGCKGQE